jgi:hypothetical protein
MPENLAYQPENANFFDEVCYANARGVKAALSENARIPNKEYCISA